MPLTLQWYDVALRLALTLLAGVLVGLNRSERGRPAGLRTTVLVALAAAVAMLQANLLLVTVGKTPDSFSVLDLMRLPLGILTGMGFIGAGAILRRGDMVRGLTTAATLWFVTVMGLCFGGGQIGLGLAALALCLGILIGLKWIESAMKQERRAMLFIREAADGPTEDDLRARLLAAGYRVVSFDVSYRNEAVSSGRMLRCEVHWQARPLDNHSPPFLQQLAQQPGVLQLRWKP